MCTKHEAQTAILASRRAIAKLLSHQTSVAIQRAFPQYATPTEKTPTPTPLAQDAI